jgi:hypothetical protein
VGTVVDVVAAADVAESAGRLIGLLLIPGAGLALLIVGLRRRSQARRWPPISPGYPVPTGSPPGYPPAGHRPPEVPQRSGGKALIVVGAVLLVLGLLGVVGVIGQRAASHSLSGSSQDAAASSGLNVGECITGPDYLSRDRDPRPVDCSGVDAVFELAFRGGGGVSCPDGKRDDSIYAMLANHSRTYCFTANLREGQCYDVDTHTGVIVPRDCTDPTANTKVTRRVDNSTDPHLCGPDARQLTIPIPPRIYCTAPPR